MDLGDIVYAYKIGILRDVQSGQLSDEDYDDPSLDSVALMGHLKWMCEEIQAGRVMGEKAHRWLGYIQGELRGLGMFSINDLRRHSRTQTERTGDRACSGETAG